MRMPVLSMELAKYRETLFCSSSMFSETAKMPYTSYRIWSYSDRAAFIARSPAPDRDALAAEILAPSTIRPATVIMGSMISARNRLILPLVFSKKSIMLS